MAISRPQLQQRLPLVDAQGRLSNEGLRALNDAFQSIFTTLDQIVELFGITDALNSDLTALAGSGVVLATPGGFSSGRLLTQGSNIVISDGGAGGNITISLAAIDTDDVPEGAINRYFTDARARLALSNGAGMAYDSATGTIAVGTKLALYAGGDTPSAFTLSIVDSADAAAWRAAIGAGTSSTTGTVTSIDVSGGTTGLTFSGGPVTTSGTVTLAGTLGVSNGGTGATTAANARSNLGLVIGTNVQAWDADLDALAALSGTNTIYYRSAANTWSAVTVGTALSFASGTLKLADTAVTPGVYGSANNIPTVNIDQQGRVIGVSGNPIDPRSVSPTSGTGYANGAGGTVTQLTSKSTAVTLNKVCGQITTNNAALGAGAEVGFTVNNSAFAATDVVIVQPGNGNYDARVTDGGAGSFVVRLKNTSGGSLSDAVTINFAIIKAVTA